MTRTRLVSVILLSASLLTLDACRREPRGRCGRLVTNLQSPAKAKDAIRQLGEKQGGKSCAKAIPELTKMFQDGLYRQDILRSIKSMGKQEVVQHKEYKTLLEAALKNEKTDAVAAAIAEEWKLKELRDDLIKLLQSDEHMKARHNALRALLSFSSAKDIEDVLIALATADPDKQGMRVNARAIWELSRARSVKGMPSVVNTLFIRDRQGARMYQAARIALLRVGGSATVDLLTNTLKGNNDNLRAFAKKTGIVDWEWKDGPELPQVLGDLANAKAAVAVAENMAAPLPDPDALGITEKALEQWKMANSNRLVVGMLTLARIGDDSVVDTLAKAIADEGADIRQRLNSATALAIIGTPKAVDALMAAYEAAKPLLRAPLLVPVSLALDAAHRPAFDELVKKEEADSPVLVNLKSEPTVVGGLEVLTLCPGDETACLFKVLAGELPAAAPKPTEGAEGAKKDPAAAALEMAMARAYKLKAIVMLSRKNADAAAVVPKLIEAFTTAPKTATDIRNYSLIALDRLSAANPGKVARQVFKGLAKLFRPKFAKEFAKQTMPNCDDYCKDEQFWKWCAPQYWCVETEARLTSFEARVAGEPGGGAAPAPKPAAPAPAPAPAPATK